MIDQSYGLPTSKEDGANCDKDKGVVAVHVDKDTGVANVLQVAATLGESMDNISRGAHSRNEH